MTDLARVTWTGDHGVEREMHATASLAKKAASELRAAGINSVVEKVTIAKLGKKELLAAIYNGDESKFCEKVEVLKAVEGVKKPKDPVVAAKLKAKTVANKHRGVAPVMPVVDASPSIPQASPGAGGKSAGAASTTTEGASSGKSSTSNSKPAASGGATSEDKTEPKPPKAKPAPTPKEIAEAAAPTTAAETKGDISTADLKKTGGIKL